MAANSKNIVGGIGILRIVSEDGPIDDIKLASEPSYKTTTGVTESVPGVGITVGESNSYIEFEMYDNCSVDPNTIGALCNATVTYREPHGRSQTWYNADAVGDSVKSGSTFTVRMESVDPAQVALGC